MLYEFTALLECSAVISANSEAEAREEIATWERAWVDTGEIVGVKDVDLFDVREPKSPDTVKDEAHVVLNMPEQDGDDA